jgi:hypothetical protein
LKALAENGVEPHLIFSDVESGSHLDHERLKALLEKVEKGDIAFCKGPMRDDKKRKPVGLSLVGSQN